MSEDPAILAHHLGGLFSSFRHFSIDTNRPTFVHTSDVPILAAGTHIPRSALDVEVNMQFAVTLTSTAHTYKYLSTYCLLIRLIHCAASQVQTGFCECVQVYYPILCILTRHDSTQKPPSVDHIVHRLGPLGKQAVIEDAHHACVISHILVFVFCL